MSIIKDKILYSKEELSDVAEWGKDRFIYRLLDLIKTELDDTGDRDWLIDGPQDQRVRISEISEKSRRVASGLTKLGFSSGQVLQTYYPNCLDFYWPVFGAWLCGGLASVSDPWLPADLISTQLMDTKATVIVTLRQFADKILEANQLLAEGERVKHVLILDSDEGDLPEGAASFRKFYDDDGLNCPEKQNLPPYNPREAAVIHWSSGTSGVPKGIVHCQEYLHIMLRKSKLPARTVSLNTNIFFHPGAFLLALDGGIFNKFTCCFIQEEVFTGDLCLDMMAKYRPTFYMCGTNHFVQIADCELGGRDLSSMLVIMPAGGKISPAARSKVKALCPNLAFIYQFYGSSEVAGVSGTMVEGSLGGVRAGVQVYIRDQEIGGKLGAGEVGEIMAKTPTMMLEYLNRPEETAAFLDEEGFAYMGDLGYYDAEGKLHFTDRIKELLKVDNHWFGPGEVEDVIDEMPEVAESVVWGVLDPESGMDVVHAGVVLRHNRHLDAEAVRAHVKSRLHHFKTITGDIHLLEAIPHNPQGKKLRREVKNMFRK